MKRAKGEKNDLARGEQGSRKDKVRWDRTRQIKKIIMKQTSLPHNQLKNFAKRKKPVQSNFNTVKLAEKLNYVESFTTVLY